MAGQVWDAHLQRYVSGTRLLDPWTGRYLQRDTAWASGVNPYALADDPTSPALAGLMRRSWRDALDALFPAVPWCRDAGPGGGGGGGGGGGSGGFPSCQIAPAAGRAVTAVTPEGGGGAGGGGGGGRRGDEFDRLGVGGDLSGPAIAQRHEQAYALAHDLREFGEVLTDPHVMLDVAGTFPGIGRAADAFNASLYAVKGNWAAAALHAAGAVPVVGESRRAARVAGIGPAGTRQVQRAVDAAPSAAATVRHQPVRGGIDPVRKGQAGEAVAVKEYGAKNTEAFFVNGRRRVPDIVLSQDIRTRAPTAIVEVKNVKYQSLTRQLRDLADLVGPDGKVFVALPVNARVSRALQKAFDSDSSPLTRCLLPMR